jgi:PhnB protein
MRIEPRINLYFNGTCDAAFALYAQCFGGTIFRLTWGDSPMAGQAPPEWHEKVVHATLTIDGGAISGGDVLPGLYRQPQGFELHVNLDDTAAAERIFTQLSDGGEVTVPLQETFWARRFGSVIDRYGVPWSINCGEPTER